MAALLWIFDNRNRIRLKEENMNNAILGEALLDFYADESQDVGRSANENTLESESLRFSDIKKFTSSFWLLTVSCFAVYGCILPFNNVAAGILFERNFFLDPPKECRLKFSDQCSQW